jgi:hypothetical protein
MLVAMQIESMKWSFHEGRGGMAHLGHKVAPPVISTMRTFKYKSSGDVSMKGWICMGVKEGMLCMW